MCFYVFKAKAHKKAYDDDMAKVTVTLYMDEADKEALQKLADAQERSLSQMAVLILKRAIVKSPSAAELSSSYRINGQISKPTNNTRITAAYLETEELQKLAEKIGDINNAAVGIDLKLKVQIELGAESPSQDEVIARLNEILQAINENLKL
jgi:hypothetical protein